MYYLIDHVIHLYIYIYTLMSILFYFILILNSSYNIHLLDTRFDFLRSISTERTIEREDIL